MGVIIHHAIVVTTWGEYPEKAHAEAIRCVGAENVSNLGPEMVNGYRSFMVSPDGSKEGWADSDQGEARRATFIAWLNRQRHRDGSTPYAWALVEYGERFQREGAAVVDHAWKVNVSDKYKGPHDLDAARES